MYFQRCLEDRILREGVKDNRSQWYIQGHIGSTWKDEQYFRTRDMKYGASRFLRIC